ncbi:hypothetical protein FG386_002162 [Cryptosporidium ryanae]|uniref:uncharacterized protein n=1 Tax=Cryptosporidium ryanae TaxID=515981 RepID=UPI003519E277|nr:hypothetical protein FG386_002162 [Cryptosporidium ryanae]
MNQSEVIDTGLKVASLGVELYISGAREFKLPDGEYGRTNESMNCICILWLPYEDPLEIFGLQQGIRWDPVLGRRCTGVAVARPCTKPGKIDSLECDFTTYIHALNVGKINYIYNKNRHGNFCEDFSSEDDTDNEFNEESSRINSEKGSIIRLEDAIKFNVEFPHELYVINKNEKGNFCIYRPKKGNFTELPNVEMGYENPPPVFVSVGYISEETHNSRLLRPSTKWRRALNAIGDGDYNLETKSPIKWIGTGMLTKKDWIKSSTSTRSFPIRLLPHEKLMEIVSKFKKEILNSIKDDEKDGSISYFYPLVNEIESRFLNDLQNNTDKDENTTQIQDNDLGTLQVQLRTFVSYPLKTRGSLKPLVKIYKRNDLIEPFFLTSFCTVDIDYIDDIPSWNDIDIWDFTHSKIHVCVLWDHEAKLIDKGGDPLKLFPFRCAEIDGRPITLQCNDFKGIKEKDVKLRCYFSGRVFLTPVPGSEPHLYLYMLINGIPFSCVKSPVLLENLGENKGGIIVNRLERIEIKENKTLNNSGDTNENSRFAGNLAFKILIWPENSKFLSRKEYSYLNLRPQKGIVHNLLHDYRTNVPDQYSAPTLGPYGVWVGYCVNDISKIRTEYSDSFKDLFGEAIYMLSDNNNSINNDMGESINSNKTSIMEITNQDRGESDEDSIKREDLENFNNSDMDTNYYNDGLRRYNNDLTTSKPCVPHMSTIIGKKIDCGVAGEWITFVIQSRDENGNKSILGGSKIHIRLRSVGYIKFSFTAEPHGLNYLNNKTICNDNTGALIKVDEGEVCKVGIDEIDVPMEWCSIESYHGVYNCRMRCEKSGQYLLRITMDGLPIAGSPYDLIIAPSLPEPKASSTVGEGTSICRSCPTVDYMVNIDIIKACNGKVPKYINSFIVILRDEFGNRISTGGHQLKAKFNSGLGKIQAIIDNWDGSYVIYYTVHLERTIQNLNAKMFGRLVNNELSNNRKNKSGTTTTRAIEQALGLSTKVSESKIEFNSQEVLNMLDGSEIQHMATNIQYNEERILDSEELMVSTINDIEISVFLNNMPIYGSPFTPKITNIEEIREWYKYVDLNSKETTERKFEKLLESNKFEDAIKLMKELEKKYLHNFKEIMNELEREPTENEKIMDIIGKKSKEQDQWTMLQRNKEKLEDVIKDNNDRENLLITFGRYLLKRLEDQMIRRQKVDSDLSAYRVLKENNLEPLCHSLEVEYNKFQQQRTRELIRLVSLLETNKLNSLEELMELYQLIADELRSLGRGNLANQFDLINRCLIEEQQLTNIREGLLRRSDILTMMDKIVSEREKALDVILNNFNQAIKMEEDHIENEIDQLKVELLRKITLNPNVGVQTDDPLSLTDTIMGPLILDRISRNNYDNKESIFKNKYLLSIKEEGNYNNDYADKVIKKYWKPLMEWDLRSFVKILKQCPRLSICLRELFIYFANTRWRGNESHINTYDYVIRENDMSKIYYDNKNVNNNGSELDMNTNIMNINNLLGSIGVSELIGNLSQSNNNNNSSINTGINGTNTNKMINRWTVGVNNVTTDDPRFYSYRRAIGISRNGFKRLLLSLDLSPHLLKSEKTIKNLFYKFSIEKLASNVNTGNSNVRVIPQELWVPLLRELAYINALIRFDILRESTLGQNALLRLNKNINDSTGKVDYSIIEMNNDNSSENLNDMSSEMNNNDNIINSNGNNNSDVAANINANNENITRNKQKNHQNITGVAVTQDNIKDLNRITAFRHFCELYLIPLYRKVYSNIDFTTMRMLAYTKTNSYIEQDENLFKEISESKKNTVSSSGNSDNNNSCNDSSITSNPSTHEKVECKIDNCLKVVISQLKMNVASSIFLKLASKSMKEFEFDTTRDLIEYKKLNEDNDILKNYSVTEFDYIKPLYLYEFLKDIGIIPGHISGSDMHSIIEKILTSREEYLPVRLYRSIGNVYSKGYSKKVIRFIMESGRYKN